MIEHDNPNKPPFEVGDLLVDIWHDEIVLVLGIYLSTKNRRITRTSWECLVFDLLNCFIYEAHSDHFQKLEVSDD